MATYDLLVIGGGINGAGIARDAAMRGLSVCLLEAHDYGSGTSSRSSMLAHGGLRYLEQFELGLVHEALQERERLFRQAPHLVRPLRFIYPLYPQIASRRTVRVGLWLYDMLSHGKSVPGRDHLKPADITRAVPGIETHDLKGGATYSDGQWTSVERFVLELILDAEAHGARCHRHTPVQGLLRRDGKVVGAKAEGADGSFEVEASAVINAAGPWVDDVNGSGQLIRKTKGSHIAVPRFCDEALIIRAKDGRTFFVLPWQRWCLVGTTDLDYPGDPRLAAASQEEIDYLKQSARAYFPGAPLDDIHWSYAGVRPLVYQEGLTESNVTRRHVLHEHHPGYWSIQGGKLTTYRSLAEEAIDQVMAHLDMTKRGHPTREGTLPGGPLVPWEEFRAQAIETARTDHGLHPDIATHIVDAYGARWRLAVRDPARCKRIVKGRPTLWCEVDVALEHEHGDRLADVTFRRTQAGYWRDQGRPVAKAVHKHMKSVLGWDRQRAKQEWQAYEEEAARLRPPAP